MGRSSSAKLSQTTQLSRDGHIHFDLYGSFMLSQLYTCMAASCAGPATTDTTTTSSAKVADFDELVDEVLAKKGPVKYTDGLSEDHWEEVRAELSNVQL